ncbi:hypothetical protein ABBQ38_15504 [Trebouxia sp. C0009 RCD-2024]
MDLCFSARFSVVYLPLGMLSLVPLEQGKALGSWCRGPGVACMFLEVFCIPSPSHGGRRYLLLGACCNVSSMTLFCSINRALVVKPRDPVSLRACVSILSACGPQLKVGVRSTPKYLYGSV